MSGLENNREDYCHIKAAIRCQIHRCKMITVELIVDTIVEALFWILQNHRVLILNSL